MFPTIVGFLSPLFSRVWISLPISVSTAKSVYGEGFEEIKTGLNIKKSKETAKEG